MDDPNLKRRWTRFSLRSLMVLVTMGCIWLAIQVNWIHQRRAFLQEPNVSTSEIAVTPPPALRLFGEQGVNDIFLQYHGWLGVKWTPADEAQKQRAIQLFPEAHIQTWGGTIQPVPRRKRFGN